MKLLKDGDKEEYGRRFRLWIKTLNDSKTETVEKFYTKIHEHIFKDSEFKKREVKKNPNRGHKKFKQIRSTNKQRKERIEKKFKIARELAA